MFLPSLYNNLWEIYIKVLRTSLIPVKEKEKGLLTKGMLADIVILSEDIFATPPKELLQVKALMTMVDGKIVYEKESE